MVKEKGAQTVPVVASVTFIKDTLFFKGVHGLVCVDSMESRQFYKEPFARWLLFALPGLCQCLP